MPKLTGFADDVLHSNIHEALKVLATAQEQYARAVQSIDGQYLRSLDVALADQVAAVRALFAVPAPMDLGGDGVRPRGFAADLDQ